MRNLILVLAMTISLTSFANITRPSNEVKSELRVEIAKLLSKANISLDASLSTEVELMVNRNGEIVVLNVNSNNEQVNSFIKSRLNYRTVKTKGISAGKIYKMPLKVIKK